MYNPYQPPGGGYPYGYGMPMPMPMPMGYGPGGLVAMWSGDGLLVPRGMQLPPVCVKCGKKDDLAVRTGKFAWSNPYLYFFICAGVVGIVLFFIFFFATRKSGELQLPVCSACNAKWNKTTSQTWMIFGGTLAAVIALLAIFGGIGSDDGAGFTMLFGVPTIILAPIIFHYSKRAGAKVWSKRVDDASFTLRGMHQDAIGAACTGGGFGPPGAMGGPPPMGPGYGGPPGYGGGFMPPPAGGGPGYGPPQW